MTASDSEKRWLWPPPLTHGVALERAQARRRLAGVGDAGAGVRDLGDVARRERRDARHALHEVEADALGGEHAARGPGDDGEHRARLEPLAVLDDELDRRSRGSVSRNAAANTSPPLNTPRLAGDEVGARDRASRRSGTRS